MTDTAHWTALQWIAIACEAVVGLFLAVVFASPKTWGADK